MKRLVILTDEDSEFLVSKTDFKNYTSMDIGKIVKYFTSLQYEVKVCKFSELDLREDFNGVNVLYQSSEIPGSFYKRYIENLIYFLEKRGAVPLPKYEYLKAHHDKTFMELLRLGFADESLKTLDSLCYGSWVDARNYNRNFPVVIKQASGSAGSGVFLARNKKEYDRYVKRAGRLIVAHDIAAYFIGYFKKCVKKLLKRVDPSKSKYYWRYNTSPLSSSIVIQKFIEGLKGDYKVLVFGAKYYFMYRKNRENDFRASGSGMFFNVPDEEHMGLLDFARKLTVEIDFPIIGMDIGFNGREYHLIEFQMIDMGPSALQRSDYWYEFHNGRWIKYDGKSNLEEEFSRAVENYLNRTSGTIQFTCD